MEPKITAQELHDANTNSYSRIDQVEERLSEFEDYLAEMRQADKIGEKRMKMNEEKLQKTWYYVKRLTGVLKRDGENGTKLENTLQDIIQENFPNLAREANIQIQKIQRTPRRYSTGSAPRHMIIRFSQVKMKKKMVRATREKGQITYKGNSIRCRPLSKNSTSQKRLGANIQHS